MTEQAAYRGPFEASDSRGKPAKLFVSRNQENVEVSAVHSIRTTTARLDNVEFHEDGRIDLDGKLYQLADPRGLDGLRAAVASVQDEIAGRVRPSRSSSGSLPAAFTDPIGCPDRFQYAVVNTGTFNSPDRLRRVLAEAGHVGWELVTVYDKSSNWFQGWEKGLMLLKRRVPEGAEIPTWCVEVRG